MEYLAWFILSFIVLQFLVALINFLFAEKMNTPWTGDLPLVSILVPARNEEHNIEKLIRSVIEQNYSNFELIVCDDQSEDRTAEIVQKFIQSDQRIQLIQKSELPDGWLGKNHTCHTLAEKAVGEYFLFLDADVRIENDIISQTIAHQKRHQLSLISIFPKQNMTSNAEKKTVPIMNYILLSLLPLILVRKTNFASIAAANGQFMFFHAQKYRALNPHEKVRSNKVEDIAIARLYKQNKHRISCLANHSGVTCQMYQSYYEAVNGFSRNIAAYFGNSLFLALFFWIVTTFGFLFIIVYLNWLYLLLFLLLYLATRIIVSLTSHQSVADNLRFVFHQQLAMGQIILQSIKHQIKKQQQWKGRNI